MKFEKLVLEVRQSDIDEVKANTTRNKPFDHIFGSKDRIVEKLKEGRDYEMEIKDVTGEDINFDFPNWVGYKTKDEIKKNPIRIGKLLAKKKVEYEKLLKENDDPEIRRKLKMANELLKMLNLQELWKIENEKIKFYIIYSRNSVDVLRMGDFYEMDYSCHAPKGGWYQCAKAEAANQGAVVFLLKEEDYLKIKDKIGEDEIFEDDDRDIEGVSPISRMRLRLVLDENENELAVPVLKQYTKTTHYLKDFEHQVKEFCLRQDVDDFDWNNLLILKGGTYQDQGYEVNSVIKKLWNVTVRYQHADGNEDEDNIYAEQARDEIRYSLGSYGAAGGREPIEVVALNQALRDLDDDDINTFLTIDIPNYDLGNIIFYWVVPSEICNKILEKEDKFEQKSADFRLDLDMERLYFEHLNIDFDEHFDFFGKQEYDFDYGGYISGIEDEIRSALNSLNKDFVEDNIVEFNISLSKALCDLYEIDFPNMDDYEEVISPEEVENKTQIYSRNASIMIKQTTNYDDEIAWQWEDINGNKGSLFKTKKQAHDDYIDTLETRIQEFYTPINAIRDMENEHDRKVINEQKIDLSKEDLYDALIICNRFSTVGPFMEKRSSKITNLIETVKSEYYNYTKNISESLRSVYDMPWVGYKGMKTQIVLTYGKDMRTRGEIKEDRVSQIIIDGIYIPVLLEYVNTENPSMKFQTRLDSSTIKNSVMNNMDYVNLAKLSGDIHMADLEDRLLLDLSQQADDERIGQMRFDFKEHFYHKFPVLI